MNIAVIFAGGTGQRMNTAAKPKQFLELHGKPILIYTLEHFQNHPMIDGIVLVCLSNYIPYCEELLRIFHITKVKKVVAGGKNGQESIFNGLSCAQQLYPENSVVLIHDGVRPLIDEDTITNAIKTVQTHNSAITVSSAVETIILKGENGNVGKILKRSECEIAKAPQCFYLADIYKAHLRARDEKKDDFIDSASLMQYYGYTLTTINGLSENIKITTPVDFYIFRAIIDARENLQILGL